MKFEAVNAVSGVISAIGALFSIVSILRAKERKDVEGKHGGPIFSYYMLFCSGWVLSVVAFNWLFEPFGSYLLPRDEKKLYGIMMSAPVLMLTLFAFKKLTNPRPVASEFTDSLSTESASKVIGSANPAKPQHPYEYTEEPPGIIKLTGKE